MSYYGGTITVAGRNLITTLMAGETIKFTRIVVGSGAMPEGVEPIDMTELVTPVAEGTSTIPTVENGAMYLTVEYRNDLNGGLKEGFWLREFGIFAQTDKTEEILLYYATLGDYPQPVNAYQENRIDIRRYPVTIALELDADVQVAYNPGAFITSSEAFDLINSMVNNALPNVSEQLISDHNSDPYAHSELLAQYAKKGNTPPLDETGKIPTKYFPADVLKQSGVINTVITIPADAWQTDDSGPRAYRADVVCGQSTSEHIPYVSVDSPSIDAATDCGLYDRLEAAEGVLRFWADSVPTADITARIALFGRGGTSSSGGILPAASSERLGAVKVGAGLNITEDGTLSVDTADEAEVNEMLAEVLTSDSK